MSRNPALCLGTECPKYGLAQNSLAAMYQVIECNNRADALVAGGAVLGLGECYFDMSLPEGQVQVQEGGQA